MTEPQSWIDLQNEPTKALSGVDLKLAASRRIRDDSGLTMISVTGKQQSGKSSYALLILYEIYNGDVDVIMNHVVFSIEEFTSKIRNAIEGGYRERCILWDDASCAGSASRWVVDPKSVMYLSALGDTLGVSTKSLILTSPSSDFVKAFRNYAKYKVIISNGRHKYDRVARGYWIGKSPMEQRWCSQEFVDRFDTRVPFYETYAKKRKELSLNVVKSMDSLFGKGEEPLTEESFITRMVISQWESGIRVLNKIAYNIKHAGFDDINHQKVGRILDEHGLRA